MSRGGGVDGRNVAGLRAASLGRTWSSSSLVCPGALLPSAPGRKGNWLQRGEPELGSAGASGHPRPPVQGPLGLPGCWGQAYPHLRIFASKMVHLGVWDLKL